MSKLYFMRHKHLTINIKMIDKNKYNNLQTHMCCVNLTVFVDTRNVLMNIFSY